MRKDEQDFSIVTLDAKIHGNLGSRESIEERAFSIDSRYSESYMGFSLVEVVGLL